MDVAHSAWAARVPGRTAPGLLQLPHDVLLEIACLLRLPTLLSLRQVCRLLLSVTREPVIFIRLLTSGWVPFLPRVLIPSLTPSPEFRITQASRLHKNWDCASLPLTVRTTLANRASPLRTPSSLRSTPPPIEPLPAPLPYHLPPGADAYPFLKLETYAPFRDTAAKPKLSLDPAPPSSLVSSRTSLPTAGSSHHSAVGPSYHLAQQHDPEPTNGSPAPTAGMPVLPPNFGNFISATFRTWHARPPSLNDASFVPDLTDPSLVQDQSRPGCASRTPPLAPAPRPVRVASLPTRAVLARIVEGGRWGVFVIKRPPGSSVESGGKGKQRAADERPRTPTELSRADTGKGKAKATEPNAAPEDELGASRSGVKKAVGEPVLVIYDLNLVDGSTPETGKMLEFSLAWTPADIKCRVTRGGVVIVLTSGFEEDRACATVLRWDYASSSLVHRSHRSKCPMGAVSIQEYQDKTLVAIVHRPCTVVIQDFESLQTCSVRLSKMTPLHTLQAIHLLPGPRLLVLRKIRAGAPDRESFVLEEYDVPAMGEKVQPTAPIQRQWIRGMDLHSCTFVEGSIYEDGKQPDIALWAFATFPHRAVVHWVLSAGIKPETQLDNDSLEDGEKDIYSDETAYPFPVQLVSTNRLSFPHHKATFAPGAKRALWFERPERSRGARGMRGIWAYTSVREPVVRNCTRELPEDALNAMENNTLGVAFDEASGRVVVLTCGDGFSAANECRIWVLDYA